MQESYTWSLTTHSSWRGLLHTHRVHGKGTHSRSLIILGQSRRTGAISMSRLSALLHTRLTSPISELASEPLCGGGGASISDKVLQEITNLPKVLQKDKSGNHDIKQVCDLPCTCREEVSLKRADRTGEGRGGQVILALRHREGRVIRPYTSSQPHPHPGLPSLLQIRM